MIIARWSLEKRRPSLAACQQLITVITLTGLKNSALLLQVGDATVPFRAEWDRHRLTPNHTAYLRIAEGCSHACSFCAIPHWR